MRTPALAVRVNPVLRRELVERMRSWRACAVLTVYLALLSFGLYVSYRSGRNRSVSEFGPSLNEVASVGRGIFEWLLFLMLLLVLFLVPGQTSGAIAGERERQTLVPLQVTLLRPRSILLGKVGAALAFLALMLLATVPLLAVCYLIGGVTIGEIFGGTALVLFVGLVVACMSTAISTFLRRVQPATVLAYGLVLMLVFGTLAVRAGFSAIDESRGADVGAPPSWIMLANPIALLADVVDDGADDYGSMESPFDAFERMQRESEAVQRVGFDGAVLEGGPIGPDGGIVFDEEFDEFGNPLADEKSSFWWQSAFWLGLVAVLAVVAAARRLRTPAASER